MDTRKFILDRHGLQEASVIDVPNTKRNALIEIFDALGYTEGAEIGVEKGIFSEEIILGMDGKVTLHLVDPWEVYDGYAHFGKNMERNFKETMERLEDYEQNIVVHRKMSLDAVNDVKDESLDFVYVDGHHGFQHVVNDICEWSKKVKMGGIICGDDYFMPKRWYPNRTHHVVEAVDAFVRAYKVPTLFLFGDQDEMGKKDKRRSWAFVKHDDYFNFQF